MAVHNPSFTLKKISHDEILADYLAGKFKDTKPSHTIIVSTSQGILCQEFSSNPNDAIYVSSNKFDSPILASTNQNAFDVYYHNERRTDIPCHWCRKTFTHMSVGMVMSYKSILYRDPKTGEDKLYEVFWVYGVFDCFECAIASIRERRKGTFTTYEFNYDSSEVYTRLLFSHVTGKRPEELKPAIHWELMEYNGGSVRDIEADKHRYVQTNSVHLAPLKIFYERREK